MNLRSLEGCWLNLAREGEEDLVQLGRDGVLGIDQSGGTFGFLFPHEHPFIRNPAHLQLGIGVVALPDEVGCEQSLLTDLAGRLDPEGFPQFADIALGHWLATHAEHAATRGLFRGTGGGHAAHEGRQRIFINGGRNPAANGLHQELHAFGRQRRRLHGQEHVVAARLDGLRQVDLFDVILLFQLFDDRLPRQLARLTSGKRKSAEQLRIGADNPDRLALGLGHRVDRANQFVFDRNSVVEEGHDDFLQPATERRTENDLFVGNGPAGTEPDLFRSDPELLFGQGRLFAEGFQVVMDGHPDLVARHRFELIEHRDQVEAGFVVLLRHVAANERIDEDRMVRFQLAHQTLRIRRQ